MPNQKVLSRLKVDQSFKDFPRLDLFGSIDHFDARALLFRKSARCDREFRDTRSVLITASSCVVEPMFLTLN